MSNEIEDLLARMKPSRVGPDMRPRVLEAVAAELASARDEGTPCSDPAGHQFVCVHCGSVARATSRVRRLATAAALAAMTCAAAVLLVLHVADHQERIADRSAGQHSQPIANESVQPKASEARGAAVSDLSFLSPRRLPRRADGRWVVSAADLELPDERLALANLPARSEATFDMKAADARISNAALLDNLLHTSAGETSGQKD
jgi:hypothetical protein